MQNKNTTQDYFDDLADQISAYYMANPSAIMNVKKELGEIKDIVEYLRKLYGDTGILNLVFNPDPYNILRLLGFDTGSQSVEKLPEINMDALSDEDRVLVELAQSIQAPHKSRDPLLSSTTPYDLKRFASTAPAELVNEVGGYRAFKFSFFDRINPGRRQKLIERINSHLINDKQQDVGKVDQATEELIDKVADNLCKIFEQVLGGTIEPTLKMAQDGSLKGGLLQLVVPDESTDVQTNTATLKQNASATANLKHVLKQFLSAQKVIHESIDESLLEQIFKTLTLDQRRLVAQKASDNVDATFAVYDRQKLASVLQ